MSNTASSCFICCGGDFRPGTRDYVKCCTCGHEQLVTSSVETLIVNDRLDVCDVGTLNSLDRFKIRVVQQCCRTNAFLLDIGSASGRFLYQNRGAFSHVAGVEVTPVCIEFSRSLGLEIVSDINLLNGSPSVVTFWHSLEHIPACDIERMLTRIRAHALPDIVLIVAVPNADSLQAKLFRKRFAFYDVPHHLHQFTLGSLDRLMDTFDFERRAMFRSFSYANFGWLQGLLNLFNRYHDYFYYRKKRGWDFGLSVSAMRLWDVYNLALISVLLLPCLILALFDAVMLRHGGVVTVCYQPKTLSK